MYTIPEKPDSCIGISKETGKKCFLLTFLLQSYIQKNNMSLTERERSMLVHQQATEVVDDLEFAPQQLSEQTVIELPRVKIPEFHHGAPDRLWKNLGLYPEMREKIDSSAFNWNNTRTLNARMRDLTKYMIHSLRNINNDFLLKLFSHYRDNTPSAAYENLVYGAALGIEAYQIEADRELFPGFAHITDKETYESDFSIAIPGPDYWSANSIDRLLYCKEPKSSHAGLFADTQQIAMYADRDIIPVGMGAWSIAQVMTKHWSTLVSSDLPLYQASGYADERMI
jgi:hypothetical protein